MLNLTYCNWIFHGKKPGGKQCGLMSKSETVLQSERLVLRALGTLPRALSKGWLAGKEDRSRTTYQEGGGGGHMGLSWWGLNLGAWTSGFVTNYH